MIVDMSDFCRECWYSSCTDGSRGLENTSDIVGFAFAAPSSLSDVLPSFFSWTSRQCSMNRHTRLVTRLVAFRSASVPRAWCRQRPPMPFSPLPPPPCLVLCPSDPCPGDTFAGPKERGTACCSGLLQPTATAAATAAGGLDSE